MNKFYTGIGSRETPDDILEIMEQIGEELASLGWTLRSGGAEGADTAFYNGCVKVNGKRWIYVPWPKYNPLAATDRSFVVPEFNDELMKIARQHHPNWDACSDAARKLHARNVCQVLGLNLDQRSLFTVCWTKNGAGGGGTGQAIRISNAYRIPVYDLGLKGSLEKLIKYIESTQS